MAPTKVCTKCGQEKPATREFFYGRPKRSDGLESSCKECDKAAARAHWHAHADDGHARQRAYREAHPEKQRAASARYRERHPEEARAHSRKCRAAHLDERRAYDREWQKRNPDKARAAGRRYDAAHPERRNAWRQANPDHVRAANSRRRARKKAAEGCYTRQDVAAQYLRQQGTCYWCGKKVGRDYHVDHVIPLARGGSNGPENLVISCGPCNTSKGAKLPHEWGDRLC